MVWDDDLRKRLPQLRSYTTLLTLEGITFRGRIRLRALLEEHPGIGEVRFRILEGPWEGSAWIRDARGLVWRILRSYPPREELSDLTPQVARHLRLEDLAWSAVLERIRKAPQVEILRADPAVMKLRLVDGPFADEITLNSQNLQPLAWTRWQGEEMIARVFYQRPREESTSRMLAWAALGVAVGVVAVGLWIWQRTQQEEEE